jgi:hypothetical protein
MVTPKDFRLVVILKGLEFLIKTGEPINTAYTWENLLGAISEITGKYYTKKTAIEAVRDLRAHIDNL